MTIALLPRPHHTGIAHFGAPPPVRSPDDFRAIVAKDLQMWKKIVADAGITND